MSSTSRETLADQDLHGLGIMNEVLERTGGRMRLWPAVLYRNLARLADLGLVAEVAQLPGARAGEDGRVSIRSRRLAAAPLRQRRSASPDSSTARRKGLLKA